MKKPKYIQFFLDDIDLLEELGDAERGRLFTACLQYSRTGAAEKLSGNERFVFPFFKARIDRFFESYEDTCRKRSDAISSRWEQAENTKECNSIQKIQKNTKEYKTYNTEPEPEAETNIPPKSPRGERTESRFSPPSVEEVRDYCAERGNAVDADVFVDFYASKGWMVGKNKMRDWKAAVRTWERNRKPEGRKGTKICVESQFDRLMEQIRRDEIDAEGG